MLKEFKEFAMRGNVLDMAVGIIIGAAFGQIVNSFVNDVLMPPLGRLVSAGHVNFVDLFVSLNGQHYDSLDAAKHAGAPTLNYGVFFNTVINFLIVAFAVFLLVRAVNRLTTKKEAPAAPTTRDCPQCAMSIPIQAKKCGHCTTQLA
jgi:large conductance mechanosensitive channel